MLFYSPVLEGSLQQKWTFSWPFLSFVELESLKQFKLPVFYWCLLSLLGSLVISLRIITLLFFYCNCNECTAVLTANAKNNTIYEFSLPITQISSSSHMRSLLNYLTVFRFVVWAQASIINHFVLKYHIFV